MKYRVYAAKLKRNLVPFLVISLAALSLYLPIFTTKGFSPKDDWKAILITADRPFHPQLENEQNVTALNSFYKTALKMDFSTGRFRPVYWGITTIEAFLFKEKPKLWHLETVIIGIFTCFLLYVIARQLKLGFIPALLCSLWLLFSGFALWGEKQIGETQGMLFTLLGLLFLIRGGRAGRGVPWDTAGIICIFLAGWVKESFVLVMPPAIILRIALQSVGFHRHSLPEVLKSLKIIVGAALLAFSIQLTIAVFAFNQGAYSSKIVGTIPLLKRISPILWLKLLYPRFQYLSYFIPMLGVIFIIYRTFKDSYIFKQILLGSLFLATWLVPQFILYADTSFEAHYFYPAAIALILLNGLSLEAIRRGQKRLFKILFYGISIFSLATILITFPKTFNGTGRKVAISNIFTRSVKHIAESNKGAKAIFVIPQAWWGLGVSTLVHLGNSGVHIPVYIDSPSLTDRSSREVFPWNMLYSLYFPIEQANPNNIDIIFACQKGKNTVQNIENKYNWFKKEDWIIYRFPESYRVINLKARALKRFLRNKSITSVLKLKAVEYKVLFRK